VSICVRTPYKVSIYSRGYNILLFCNLKLFDLVKLYIFLNVLDELSYASGEIYYANWPMIVSKEGNKIDPS
jgi:hypothetical protein